MFKDWFFFGRKKANKQIITDNRVITPERVYTPVHLLQIGMFVAELDRPWLETDFLFQGFEITQESEIQKIRGICSYVYIDTTKLKKRIKIFEDNNVLKSLAAYPSAPKKLSNFEDEINRAEEIYHTSGAVVLDFMDRIAKGEGVDTQQVKQVVAECVNSILHSPDASIWLTQLKNRDEYTAQHSLNVCVLAIVLGRHIGLSEAHLNQAGLCGMMHDVGKMLVPLEILNKPGRLEDDEMKIMQSHTTLGHELLLSSHDMYFGACEAALGHHERIDGKGYPKKFMAEGLPLYTKMVAIVDMYDAITSDRVYQKGRTHLEATKIMFEMMGLHLDELLVIKFVESLGVYPPGCFVELTNGCVGLVVEINEKSRLRPKVLLILDQEKNPIPERIVDLSLLQTDEQGDVYTIRNITKAESHQINASDFYQRGILQRGFALGKR
ncbi:MAG: HD-GYP domain-containing protein [Methylococcaceae bacterium]|jgi:HD-GYP domain-containing protein (c-di-GMP phosphodiesterase class II)